MSKPKYVVRMNPGYLEGQRLYVSSDIPDDGTPHVRKAKRFSRKEAKAEASHVDGRTVYRVTYRVKDAESEFECDCADCRMRYNTRAEAIESFPNYRDPVLVAVLKKVWVSK